MKKSIYRPPKCVMNSFPATYEWLLHTFACLKVCIPIHREIIKFIHLFIFIFLTKCRSGGRLPAGRHRPSFTWGDLPRLEGPVWSCSSPRPSHGVLRQRLGPEVLADRAASRCGFVSAAPLTALNSIEGQQGLVFRVPYPLSVITALL